MEHQVHDISAFMAFGKRFSLDIKLHGIGCLRDKFEFESNDYGLSLCYALVAHAIPSVCALAKNSCNEYYRDAGVNLAHQINTADHPAQVLMYLGEFVQFVNRDC